MPGIRKYRAFSEKQKAALKNRKKKRTVLFSPMLGPGTDPLPVKENTRPSAKHLEAVLNDYLVNYDARLLEINHKYPLGNPERPEWIEIHRRNGVKRIREITRASISVNQHC